MADRYDVAVIGAGPGGYVAAIRAAQLGMKVACIQKDDTVGGTCLNVGCIPSKTLLHWTEHYDIMKRHGADFGMDASALTVDWSRLQASKSEVIGGLTTGIKGLFKKNKIDHHIGKARFVSKHMVELHHDKGKDVLEAENFIIATGSEPTPLPFLPFDEERVVSSTGALSLDEVPKAMVVIGAGVIGVELASVYNRLGTTVTIVEMLDTVCPTMDPAISKMMNQIFEKQGMKFHLGAQVERAKVDENSVSVMVKSGSDSMVLKADAVLVAVGRRPYTENLGLDEIGVYLNDSKQIPVNEHFQTTAANVYAIGDVIDGPMLAHKASEEGAVCAEVISGKEAHINYMCIPNVVYTSPEVASVGLTEPEARSMGLDVMVGTFPFKANSRARCIGDDAGIVKVIGDKRSGRLAGLHIIAPHAGELIHEGVIAIEKKATVEDVANACHAHPTLSEAIKEAALKALGRAIHM